MSVRHVIWDWNGTLADDLGLVVGAVNEALRPFGAGPIVPDDYRTHYTRPVHLFYERLLERPVTGEEWEELDRRFHEAYRAGLTGLRLAADALPALERVGGSGATQSILSMFPHEELVPLVAGRGLAGHFLRVDGLRGPAGERKAAHLAAHLEGLRGDLGHGFDGRRPVMIGDALDDARAALEAGIGCVLYDGGSHHRTELEAAGVPVAGTLLEAVEAALDGSPPAGGW